MASGFGEKQTCSDQPAAGTQLGSSSSSASKIDATEVKTSPFLWEIRFNLQCSSALLVVLKFMPKALYLKTLHVWTTFLQTSLSGTVCPDFNRAAQGSKSWSGCGL